MQRQVVSFGSCVQCESGVCIDSVARVLLELVAAAAHVAGRSEGVHNTAPRATGPRPSHLSRLREGAALE